MTTENSLLVGLDLDHCVFDTHGFFYDGVLPLLAKNYPAVTPEVFMASMDRFRAPVGVANYYDFFAQIRDLGLDEDEIEALVRSEISGNQLLNPGVLTFLERQQQLGHEVDLITIGFERYQRLKQSCVPTLANLPIHATLEPKGAFIAQTFNDHHGFHIDDKDVTDLPPNVQLLKIVAEGELAEYEYRDFEDLLQRGPAQLLR